LSNSTLFSFICGDLRLSVRERTIGQPHQAALELDQRAHMIE
jgi:hypothetical protein